VTVHGRKASKRLVPNARAGRDELVWRCDVCRRPIADGAGYVCVNRDAIRAYNARAEAWEAEHVVDGFYTAGALFDHPELVPWKRLHTRCDPDVDADDYFIVVSQLRSPAAVLRWCAHLGEKEWLDRTTWSDVLRDVAAQLDAERVA
jgi:hypothetical protein